MMSNSHEQSLDENVVFSLLTENSPEFLYCEAERCALEHLLSSGPGAFYSRLGAERLGPFLSPEEVNQVSSWAEEYHSSNVPLENGKTKDEERSGIQGVSEQYFPTFSDMPPPSLELGWPEKKSWGGMGQAVVYTNPPVDNAPHVREVVRRILQGATKLIAIVMDRLTDSTVIRDLHIAASRGVAIYIILNRRSVQENFTPNRLRHPNIMVRTVGGKTFLSRNGRMVVGELKENFVLVDLETVILGNYSLTWTDAHLHRQLITIISGPVVQSFDREFRVLYAFSLPIPDTGNASKPVGVLKLDGIHAPYKSKHLEAKSHKTMFLDSSWNPPSPPSDSTVDWDALGVFKMNNNFTEGSINLPGLCEEPPQARGLTEGSGAEKHSSQKNEDQDESKEAAEARHRVERQPVIRSGQKYERHLFSKFNKSKSIDHEEREDVSRPRDSWMDMKQKEEFVPHRRDSPLRVPRTLGESSNPEKITPQHAEDRQKKPLILRVPQSESFNSLNEILKRIKSGQGVERKEAKTSISRSMLDLSLLETDTPQRSQSGIYNNAPLTPALALMKKRQEESKSGFLRPPRNMLPLQRPRSSSFALKREPWKSPFSKESMDEEDK